MYILIRRCAWFRDRRCRNFEACCYAISYEFDTQHIIVRIWICCLKQLASLIKYNRRNLCDFNIGIVSVRLHWNYLQYTPTHLQSLCPRTPRCFYCTIYCTGLKDLNLQQWSYKTGANEILPRWKWELVFVSEFNVKFNSHFHLGRISIAPVLYSLHYFDDIAGLFIHDETTFYLLWMRWEGLIWPDTSITGCRWIEWLAPQLD